MGLWKRLAGLFAPGRGTSRRYLNVYILNFRCNEPLATQIDLYNDPSPTEDGGNAAFYIRKLLSTSGHQRCFATNEIQIWLDRRRQIVNYEVEGGKWLTAEEYEQEMIQFQARTSAQADHSPVAPTPEED